MIDGMAAARVPFAVLPRQGAGKHGLHGRVAREAEVFAEGAE
jgi:hypothetical protein